MLATLQLARDCHAAGRTSIEPATSVERVRYCTRRPTCSVRNCIIVGLLVAYCSYLATVVRCTVAGPSLWLVRWPGTCYLVLNTIRDPTRFFDSFLPARFRSKNFYQFTSAYNALEALRLCAV